MAVKYKNVSNGEGICSIISDFCGAFLTGEEMGLPENQERRLGIWTRISLVLFAITAFVDVVSWCWRGIYYQADFLIFLVIKNVVFSLVCASVAVFLWKKGRKLIIKKGTTIRIHSELARVIVMLIALIWYSSVVIR